MLKRIIKDLSGEKLFLFAFCIYLIVETLTTTTFPIPWRMIEFGRTVALALIVWKIIGFDCLEFRTLLWIVLLFANALAVKIFAGYWEPLRWVLLLAGAHDVSIHKILKSYLVISLSILLYAFEGSLLGIIVNLQYDAGLRGIRNSFGIIYPTDFAAHVFFPVACFSVFKKRESKKRDVFVFSRNCRTDLVFLQRQTGQSVYLSVDCRVYVVKVKTSGPEEKKSPFLLCSVQYACTDVHHVVSDHMVCRERTFHIRAQPTPFQSALYAGKRAGGIWYPSLWTIYKNGRKRRIGKPAGRVFFY